MLDAGVDMALSRLATLPGVARNAMAAAAVAVAVAGVLGADGAAAGNGAGVGGAEGVGCAVIGGVSGLGWVALKHLEHMFSVAGDPKKPQPFAHNWLAGVPRT